VFLERESYQPTLESLLVRRLEKIFESMDIADGFLFDEIVEEMEMLLQLKPPAYNELMAFKNNIMDKASALINEVSNISNYTSNEIQKRNFLEGEMSAIEWDARKEYLERIVAVMGKHQMIPFEKPVAAEINQAEFASIQEEEEEQPQPEPQPKPTTKSKKPRISSVVKNKKSPGEEPFEV